MHKNSIAMYDDKHCLDLDEYTQKKLFFLLILFLMLKGHKFVVFLFSYDFNFSMFPLAQKKSEDIIRLFNKNMSQYLPKSKRSLE